MEYFVNRMKVLLSMIKPFWFPYGASTLIISTRNYAINMLNAMLFSSIAYAARIQDVDVLRNKAILFFSLLVLFVTIDTIAIHCQALTIHNMSVDVRKKIYCHYLSIPMSALQKIGGTSGDLLSRLNSDISLIENIFSFNLLYPIMLVVSGIGGCVSIFAISPVILGYLLTVGMLALLAKILLSKNAYQYAKEGQERFAHVITMLNQLTLHLPNIQLMNLTHAVQLWLLQRLEAFGAVLNLQALHNSKISFSTSVVDILGYIGISLISIPLMQNGVIHIEDILFILQLSGMVIDMFLLLGDSVVTLQQSITGVDRIIEIESIPLENKGNIQEIDNLGFSEAILADKLSIHLPDGNWIDYPRLINIPAKKITALYGESGCGKSTLARMMVGLQTEYKGAVYYFGKPLEDYSLATLRSNITYVPQKDYYIQGTIIDNLKLGCNNLTSSSDVEVAAQISGCDKWIINLPRKYQERLLYNGESLSGGQCQTISIARAILRKSQTIIFDETFSHIDSSLIPFIIDNLKQLQKTIVIITHDSSIVERCDCVINLMDKQR